MDFPIKMATIDVTYKPAEIAGKTYNLPSRSEVRMKDSAHLYVNEIQFRDYHRFVVESTIHYDSDVADPETVTKRLQCFGAPELFSRGASVESTLGSDSVSSACSSR